MVNLLSGDMASWVDGLAWGFTSGVRRCGRERRAARWGEGFNSKNRDERYDYLYTPEELVPIAQSLVAMEKKVTQEPGRREAKKVIAATNNHYKGQAAVNAIDLKRLLGVKENPIPGGLLREYPQLKGGGESSTQPTSKGNQAPGARHQAT
jgi:hypothetical protein